MPVWSGGMDETGIGRAVNIHLQTVDGFTLPGDTSETSRYFHEDIVEPPVVLDDDGFIEVPRGAGIGVAVVPDRLRAVHDRLRTAALSNGHDRVVRPASNPGPHGPPGPSNLQRGILMRRLTLLLGLLLALAVPASFAGQAPGSPDQDFVLPQPVEPLPEPLATAVAGIGAPALAAHIRVLASPSLEGRGLGDRGLDAAARVRRGVARARRDRSAGRR